MVDFKRLVKKKPSVDVSDLTGLFESLDRHASHTDLRPTQKEALNMIQQRRIDSDLVLKISTGAGKTTVALLYLLSHMEEKEEPVVYLCPTVQLVEQVKQEATKLGIDAVVYPAGETYPHVDGTSAKAIIICTYAKLFNAKSTFDRSDVLLRPRAIVLDDAHAGIEEIRKAFTLHISDGKLYGELIKIFDSSLEKYKPAIWQMIIKQDPNAALELPYWIWKPVIASVQRIIGERANNREYMFVWPFIQDILR